jgi:hypothetical protein
LRSSGGNLPRTRSASASPSSRSAPSTCISDCCCSVRSSSWTGARSRATGACSSMGQGSPWACSPRSSSPSIPRRR